MPEQLSGLLVHVTGTPPWLPRLVKVSTSSELYTDCFQLPTFRSGIQFFDLPPFPNTASQTTFGYLLLTVQHLCDLQDAMPRHDHQVLLTQPLPRKAEDFPRGGNHSKHVLLPTYLA